MKNCGNCKRWIVENAFQKQGKCEIIGVGLTKHSTTCQNHSFGQQKTIFGHILAVSTTKTPILDNWAAI